MAGTGLLFYNARYYNPALGRFVSPDSVVPGNASGGLDGVALKPLTVDFHEPGLATQLATENAQPFWFEMSDQQRQQAGRPWGPANPQALNRYSYVLNNPARWTDPSGHVIPIVVVVVVVGVILVGGALVAVNASPSSGYNLGNIDWTYWPIPGYPNSLTGDESSNSNATSADTDSSGNDQPGTVLKVDTRAIGERHERSLIATSKGALTHDFLNNGWIRHQTRSMKRRERAIQVLVRPRSCLIAPSMTKMRKDRGEICHG